MALVSRTSELHLQGLPKYTRWGAIFAGSFVAGSILILLTLLGVAVGAVFAPTVADPFVNSGVGTQIWLVCESIIAFFCGGWVAGRLSGSNRNVIGGLHGLAVWGLITVAALFVIGTTYGMMVNSATNLVILGMNTMMISTVPAPGLAGMTQGLAIGAFIGLILNGIAAALGGTAGVHGYEAEAALEEKLEERREYPKAA